MPELRLHPRLDEIAACDWDRLHDGRNPFVQHAFLDGLEHSGSLRARWGWTPMHAGLWEDGQLVAAAPAYLKANSHGEFVFDHSWAHAIEAHGGHYYPKWLVAVPYSPVAGPRLLARDQETRVSLLDAMRTHAAGIGLSSLHVNFAYEPELEACDTQWLARSDLQFHWHRDPRWRDFGDFLDALLRRKRRNVLAERRKVREAGISLRIVDGDAIRPQEIAAVHALYASTFLTKGNAPALTAAYFAHLARSMPDQVVFVLAERGPQLVAAAVCLRGGETLYGRYWGCTEAVPGLHFEACYYQGIEYCLRERLATFEPGAQGEHKLARGFLPVPTHSRHWIAEPALRDALRTWCAQERAQISDYATLLLRHHNPYRDAVVPAP